MAKNEDGLVLYLPFNEIGSGKVLDLSGNGNNATISGAPVIAQNPWIGSAMTLSGDSQSLTVADAANLRIVGDQTISMWLRPSALGQRRNPFAKAYGGEGSITLEANGRMSYYFGSSGKNAQPYQGFTTTEKLAVGTWTHVAVVRDLKAKRVTWYFNGSKVLEGDITLAKALKASKAAITIGRGYVEEYAGDMAHLRLYNRALSPEALASLMDADQTAYAAYRTTQPISFSLQDTDEQNVLSIREPDSRDTYVLELRNDARRRATLTASDGTGAGSLALSFRPGTLVNTSLDQISEVSGTWTTRAAIEPDGVVTLKFDAASDMVMEPGESLRLSLQNIAVSPAGGNRNTRVQLAYSGVVLGGEAPVSGTRQQNVAVVDLRGKPSLPLHLGITGPRAVVNDDSLNQITLRVTNTSIKGSDPIRFNPKSHKTPTILNLRFLTTDTGELNPDALTTTDIALGFDVRADGQAKTAPKGGQGQALIFPIKLTRTQLAPGESFDIVIKKIRSVMPAGPAAVWIDYENVPGYRTGTLQTSFQKSPLVFGNGHAVGVGVQLPTQTLDVRGGLLVADSKRDARSPDVVKTQNALLVNTKHSGFSGSGTDHAEISNDTENYKTLMLVGNRTGGFGPGQGRRVSVWDRLEVNGEQVITQKLTVGTTLKATDPAPSAAIEIKNNNYQLAFTNVSSGNQWAFHHYKNDTLYLLYRPGRKGNSAPFSIAKTGVITSKGMTVTGKVGLSTSTPGARLEINHKDYQLALTNGAGNSWTFHSYKDKILYFQNRVNGTWKSNAMSLTSAGVLTLKAGLKIGSYQIGAKELKILRALAAGSLEFDFYNTKQKEYMYAADYAPYDKDRRRVFTWRKGSRISQGRWRIVNPK